MEIRSTVRNPEALGAVVRQARMAAGLTQQELAQRLGMPKQMMWNLENGRSTKAIDRLFAVLRETGVTLHALHEEPTLADDSGER